MAAPAFAWRRTLLHVVSTCRGWKLVIHADLPTNSETLLHRSGRTGRAGQKGVSAIVVPMSQRRKAERLLEGAKVSPAWVRPPSAEEIIERDGERLLADASLQENVNDDERDFVTKLLDSMVPRRSPLLSCASIIRSLCT